MFDRKITVNDLDKIIHEPARLIICVFLNEFEEVDFNFLLNATGLSNGNLVTHLRKIEDADYIDVRKKFKGRKPCTSYAFNAKGRKAYKKHIKKLKTLIG